MDLYGRAKINQKMFIYVVTVAMSPSIRRRHRVLDVGICVESAPVLVTSPLSLPFDCSEMVDRNSAETRGLILLG